MKVVRVQQGREVVGRHRDELVGGGDDVGEVSARVAARCVVERVAGVTAGERRDAETGGRSEAGGEEVRAGGDDGGDVEPRRAHEQRLDGGGRQRHARRVRERHDASQRRAVELRQRDGVARVAAGEQRAQIRARRRQHHAVAADGTGGVVVGGGAGRQSDVAEVAGDVEVVKRAESVATEVTHRVAAAAVRFSRHSAGGAAVVVVGARGRGTRRQGVVAARHRRQTVEHRGRRHRQALRLRKQRHLMCSGLPRGALSRVILTL